MPVRPFHILVVSNYNDYHSVRPEGEIFISLAARGHHVTVFTYADSTYAQRLQGAGIRVIDHHPSKKYDRSSIKLIREELLSGTYDFMHLYNNKALSNGLLAARGLPVKVIGYRGSTLNFAWYTLENYLKHLSPRLDCVICNSSGVRDLYTKHPFFDSDKAVTINKGHDLDWYADVDPFDVRKELGIGRQTTILTMVATDRSMKGVKYLCKAMHHLPAALDFRLLLIGKGMDSLKYQRIIARSPHQEKVIVQGHNPAALRWVAGSDVFVLSSVAGESITKAVLEAMSLGVCPVITDIPGNVELVDHRVNGLIMKAADPHHMAETIVEIVSSVDARTQYGQASRERIRTVLCHRQTVNAYEELYRDLSQ